MKAWSIYIACGGQVQNFNYKVLKYETRCITGSWLYE